MINLDDASNANEHLALEVFKAMDDGALPQRMSLLCTEDMVWTNSGLPTLHGQAEIFALMEQGGFRQHIPILDEMTHFSADLIHIASRDNVVFTERIDHHWAADGRDLMTPHIVGVIEIRDGKVCALRDFYDVACYEQKPVAVDPNYTLEAHRQRVAAR
ncbi:MAG: limonene-1,2-epoxide hydrolase family protein [Pseudomonadales bacterium]